MAASKPSLRVEIDPSLLEQLRALSKKEQKDLGELIQDARRSFGRPHLHSGAGIRDLGHGVYECRHGLRLRLLFTAHPGYLYFHFLGNHDEVKRFLKEP